MSKRSKTDLIIHNNVREQSSKNCSEIEAYNALPQSNLKKYKSDSHSWHRREPTRLQPLQCCSGYKANRAKFQLKSLFPFNSEKNTLLAMGSSLSFPFFREYKPAKLSSYRQMHGNCFPPFSLTSFTAADITWTLFHILRLTSCMGIRRKNKGRRERTLWMPPRNQSVCLWLHC